MRVRGGGLNLCGRGSSFQQSRGNCDEIVKLPSCQRHVQATVSGFIPQAPQTPDGDGFVRCHVAIGGQNLQKADASAQVPFANRCSASVAHQDAPIGRISSLKSYRE